MPRILMRKKSTYAIRAIRVIRLIRDSCLYVSLTIRAPSIFCSVSDCVNPIAFVKWSIALAGFPIFASISQAVIQIIRIQFLFVLNSV
jgi:hypothetical protein